MTDTGLTKSQIDYESAKMAQIKENERIQKEASQLSFKQDCRRTALQLAERSLHITSGNNASISDLLSNAELLYQWLINLNTPALPLA